MMYKLILIGIVAAAVGFFVWDYTNTKHENKRLNNELSAANSTIEMLDQKAEAEAAITNNTERMLDDIRNAPQANDAPVAPVLDDTIDRL